MLMWHPSVNFLNDVRHPINEWETPISSDAATSASSLSPKTLIHFLLPRVAVNVPQPTTTLPDHPAEKPNSKKPKITNTNCKKKKPIRITNPSSQSRTIISNLLHREISTYKNQNQKPEKLKPSIAIIFFANLKKSQT